MGETDELITEHALYKALGTIGEQRNKRYKNIIDKHNITIQQDKITKATVVGEVYASSEFDSKTSGLISRATKLASHGEDRKSEGYKKSSWLRFLLV